MLMFSILFCLVALNIAWLGFILLVLTVFVPVIVGFALKNRLKNHVFLTLLVTSLLIFISATIFFVNAYGYKSDLNSGTYAVSGTVDDSYSVDGERKIILKNVSFGGSDYGGKLMLTVSGESEAKIGDTLGFSSYVTVRKVIDGYNVNGSILRTEIRYYAHVDASRIKIVYGEPDFISKLNSFVKDKLKAAMGDRLGVIAYGILTGDKNEISSSVRDTFSTAGMAHILAVSGLHIGFLLAVITFILRRLKVRRVPTFIVNSVVVLLYSVFAGFSPSVIRTCVMFFVGGGAMLLGEEKDGLNSLGFAATVMLTFSPFMLFESGFVMSVSAVFGLICFAPVISRALVRIKLPSRVANMIAAPIGAQLGILPASAYFYGSIQTYSVIANIVFMPLISIAFIAVFVTLILSIILPFLGFLLTGSGYLVRGLAVAADFFSRLPYATVAIKSSFVAFIIYPLYFLVSGFVNAKHKRTLTAVGFTLIVMIIVALML